MAKAASQQLPEARPEFLDDVRSLMRGLPFVRPHWRRLAIAVLALFAHTAAVMAGPWLVKVGVDSFITEGDLTGLNMLLLGFVVAGAAQFSTNWVHVVVMAYVRNRLLYTVRAHAFGHIQRLPMAYFDRNEAGKIMSRVQDDVYGFAEFLGLVVFGLTQVVTLVGVVIAMILMSPLLAAVTLTMLPILIVAAGFWRRSFVFYRREREAFAELNSEVQEVLSGIRVVQSLNREEDAERRLTKANRAYSKAEIRGQFRRALMVPLGNMPQSLGLALIVAAGGALATNGAVEIGVLVAFALYIDRFYSPLVAVNMWFGRFQRGLASAVRVFELLDESPEVSDKLDATPLPPVSRHVRFNGVGFHYDPRTPVLKDIDLQVNPGEMVALVGPTGAGKTTLVSLLLRLYDVKETRVPRFPT